MCASASLAVGRRKKKIAEKSVSVFSVPSVVKRAAKTKAPLSNRLRLAQIPKITCAKFEATRTGFCVTILAKPTIADLDSANSSTLFADIFDCCLV